MQFQSTLPARGATAMDAEVSRTCCQFQSTLPARGATHALSGCASYFENFNPRSPHGERRWQQRRLGRLRRFQSTLPARGATRCFARPPRNPSDFNPRSPHGERPGVRRKRHGDGDFNPRSPHGERLRGGFLRRCLVTISIHAPRTGSDATGDAIRTVANTAFQSTLPARGATISNAELPVIVAFQSTLPARGATRCACHTRRTRHQFQSTLPARGATTPT